MTAAPHSQTPAQSPAQTPAPTPGAAAPTQADRSLEFKRSLSTRLLYLTILFVLIAEAVVLMPSIAKHRVDWMRERVEAAYLVTLALSSEQGRMMSDEMADELLATASIKGVRIWRNGEQQLIRATTIDPDRSRPRHFVDLTQSMQPDYLTAPWAALFSTGDDLIAVRGKAMYGPEAYVDILVSQSAQRADLFIYARNVLILSLIISIITAVLLYRWLASALISPVKRLLANMSDFEANPEDPANILAPSARPDEIGAAERRLASMERRTQDLLAERRRLAALGAGISKLSHDLRNILASAQLMSDRLAKSDDPRVRRLSPRLIAALDRAISLSRETLSYAQMGPGHLKKEPVNLAKLADDVIDATASMRVVHINETPRDLRLVADYTQLYRAVFNLVRNAVDALTPAEDDANGDGGDSGDAADVNGTTPKRIVIRARRVERPANPQCVIEIADTGPGVPDQAREHLFEPFKGSMKPGGSGLGVAIAFEIARAHGGRLELAETGPAGSTFRFTLPIGALPEAAPPRLSEPNPERAARDEERYSDVE